ncbi:hypothetical protein VTN02DRAFT_4181 [Thermoascus thermophilus]
MGGVVRGQGDDRVPRAPFASFGDGRQAGLPEVGPAAMAARETLDPPGPKVAAVAELGAAAPMGVSVEPEFSPVEPLVVVLQGLRVRLRDDRVVVKSVVVVVEVVKDIVKPHSVHRLAQAAIVRYHPRVGVGGLWAALLADGLVAHARVPLESPVGCSFVGHLFQGAVECLQVVFREHPGLGHWRRPQTGQTLGKATLHVEVAGQAGNMPNALVFCGLFNRFISLVGGTVGFCLGLRHDRHHDFPLVEMARLIVEDGLIKPLSLHSSGKFAEITIVEIEIAIIDRLASPRSRTGGSWRLHPNGLLVLNISTIHILLLCRASIRRFDDLNLCILRGVRRRCAGAYRTDRTGHHRRRSRRSRRPFRCLALASEVAKPILISVDIHPGNSLLQSIVVVIKVKVVKLISIF